MFPPRSFNPHKAALAVALVFSVFTSCAYSICWGSMFKYEQPWLCEDLQFTSLTGLLLEKGDSVVVKDETNGKTKVGVWIAGSPTDLYSVSVLKRKLRVAHFSISSPLLSEPEKFWGSKFTPKFPDGWSKEKAYELIKRLDGKKLPYGKRFCNANHYMRYIIYLRPWARWTPSWLSNCPLHRDLRRMTVDDIKSKDFYLEDSRYILYVDKFRDYHSGK